MYFDQHCYNSLCQSAFSILVLSPLRYKPLHLGASLKPLLKMYTNNVSLGRIISSSLWYIISIMYSVTGLKTPVEVVCSNQFAIYIHE